MKVVLILFSLFFLFSAMNDCCLSEVSEELAKITETTHSDEDHSNETEACEECECSTFCSYNLVTESIKPTVIIPISRKNTLNYSYKITKEKNIPESIFHPPIA